MDKNQHKIEFLREVLARKAVLFGQFSDCLTKQDKNDAWKSVHAIALALGLCPSSKDHTYSRDVLWQNLRKAAMRKKDNSKQTGSGGGVEVKFTPIDNIIFEIIGKDSPVIDGLPVQESLAGNSTESHSLPVENEEEGAQRAKKPEAKKPKKVSYKNTEMEIDELQMLKIKKAKLTIALLKKENVLRELQIIKLRNEINDPTESVNVEYLDFSAEDSS